MSSSELSDALNPHAFRRASIAGPESALQVAAASARFAHHTPLRSSLDAAIFEPHHRSQHSQHRHVDPDELCLPPGAYLGSSDLIKHHHTRPSQVEADILRALCDSQRATEAELRRRIAWEQAFVSQQAEYNQKMLQMQQEIHRLNAALVECRQELTTRPSPAPSYYHSSSSAEPISRPHHPVTPLSPISRETTFAQDQNENFSSLPAEFPFPFVRPDRPAPATRVTPPASSPESSEQTTSSVSPETSPSPPVIRMKNKRRGRSLTPSTSRDSEDSCESSGSRISRPPRKRLNHHDKRCLTIQHALRAHFWRMLRIQTDDRLPDSHVEGEPLEPFQPVRFVWDKTTKQSVHNARMKIRILNDIKENRQLYKHVPSKDFGKKILDAAFEQCFTTFRQKYRAQTDVAVALQTKKREEAKARKARHVSRRKMKLSNRAESRLKLPEFENVVFDPALQMECMSSEESDFEDGIRSTDTLRTRGYAWRSKRLLHFYYVLDQEDMSDKSSRPKRGVGKRGRIQGPPKDLDLLPPKGVSTWMISRRWLRATRRRHPGVLDTLEELVDDSVQFEWGRFHVLGEETEGSDTDAPVNDSGPQPGHQFPPPLPLPMPSIAVHPQHRSTASSLDYALVH
ncbi:hypothetical protein MD484_g3981, partial [Candolleomyces efflorescens]